MNLLEPSTPLKLPKSKSLKLHTALKTLLGSLLCASFALVSNTAVASLGQPPTKFIAQPSVDAPNTPVARVLASVRNVKNIPDTSVAAYTVQETLLESGTAVREFMTPSGVVFAVAWKGPMLPDLELLLGDYFKAFKLKTEQNRLMGSARSPVNMVQEGLVVRSNGRMRNFSGSAYVTSLVPSGVVINNVLE